jgi:hypothetical protein
MVCQDRFLCVFKVLRYSLIKIGQLLLPKMVGQKQFSLAYTKTQQFTKTGLYAMLPLEARGPEGGARMMKLLEAVLERQVLVLLLALPEEGQDRIIKQVKERRAA